MNCHTWDAKTPLFVLKQKKNKNNKAILLLVLGSSLLKHKSARPKTQGRLRMEKTNRCTVRQCACVCVFMMRKEQKSMRLFIAMFTVSKDLSEWKDSLFPNPCHKHRCAKLARAIINVSVVSVKLMLKYLSCNCICITK